MNEITVTDGQRHVGRVLEKPNGFECFDAADRYLCKAVSVPEARAAIIRADREHQAELHRLADDGAPAA